MLIDLAQHVVADARAREAEGDFPSPRRYSAEQVESALVTVADALLAAEAKADALKEALALFGSGAVVFYENEPDDCVLSLGRWKYQEDGRARFYADVQFTVADVRRAHALTEKNNG